MLVVGVVSVALMVIDHRQSHLETVRAALSVVVYPLQYLVNLPVDGGRWASELLATRGNLLEENARLREQNLMLRSRSQKFAALETENMRLRELLESSFKVGERVLVADLLAVALEPASRQVVINKGANQGVFVGQPIVDSEGIMGQVTHVGPFSSTCTLITDPSHALPVQINRTGLRALAVGGGATNTVELAYIPTNADADLEVGDLVVSSGMGGRFPPGYPVGTVASVQVDAGEPFARVTVTPSAQLKRAREVLLVWPEDTGIRAAQVVVNPEEAP